MNLRARFLKPCCAVAVLALGGCNLGSAGLDALGISDDAIRGRRQGNGSVACTIQKVCTQYLVDETDPDGPKRHEHSWACRLDEGDAVAAGRDELKFDALPHHFEKKHDRGLHLGQMQVRVKNPVISDGIIEMPSEEDLEIIAPQPPQGGVVQQGLEMAGDSEIRTVLVVRIAAADATAVAHLSAAEISDDVFGGAGDPVNLASQYEACSHAKQIFEPATTGNNIVGGVVEVSVNAAASDGDSTLRNLALTAAAEVTGVSLSTYDHVMLAMPPGAMSGIAYGYIGGRNTVYNDIWVTNVSAQMHEIGHNLRLAHSNESGRTYADQMGMMGYSYNSDDSPRMCFNAAKIYQFGWVMDREHHFDQRFDANWSGTVIGLVDYAEAVQGQHEDVDVVVKIEAPGVVPDALYLTLNAKKGFNNGTVEGGNLITVVRQSATRDAYSQSDLVAKLGAGAQYEDFGFGSTEEGVRITVNSITLANDGISEAAIAIERLAAACHADADCDDGNACNGSETCDSASGDCLPGADPVICSDDGLFCNGIETCNPATGQCEGVDVPCLDPMGACQQASTCQEGEEGALCMPGEEIPDCCGNNVCEEKTAGENCYECSADCGQCPEACRPNGICETGESCSTCPEDCISGQYQQTGHICGNGICEKNEDCQTCPADCNNRSDGKPSSRFCCVGGPAEAKPDKAPKPDNDQGSGSQVDCSDPRCTQDGYQCTHEESLVFEYCCGDGVCMPPAEDAGVCSPDCGA